jgi:hypothetical protein
MSKTPDVELQKARVRIECATSLSATTTTRHHFARPAEQTPTNLNPPPLAPARPRANRSARYARNEMRREEAEVKGALD